MPVARTCPPEPPVRHTRMEGQEKSPGPAPAREGGAPLATQALSSNGSASPRGWLSRKVSRSRSLSPFGPRTPTRSNHKLSYLERVVLELVESERMYVRDLRSIVEDYLGQVIDAEQLLLQPEQVSALFGNIEDIYALNSELLQDLDSCDSDPVAVARCFVDRSPDFDIYTQYCNNYPNSVAALTECMRNKHQAKFFRERQEQIGHALPLGSYLLKPVQRILKYHLLLQEIAKHFDMEEPGYEGVEEAIDTMTGVAWYINDMKRRHEHAVRLQEIQSLLLHWKGPDLTTFGELVLEGTFRVHRLRNERTFFLFDRTLLITKRRGDHFVYKTHIPCSSLMLVESAKDSLCFSVTHYKHKQEHNIHARSLEEKRLWTHHIKRLILENHHTMIPQKAKEAILEMDPSHPARYRYSPERLKKARSCQPLDEVPARDQQGRRQSEPSRRLAQQLGARGLKHFGSARALLEPGEPFPPPSSAWLPVETQGGAEEEEAAGMEEQAQGTGSLEELAVSDSEKEAGPEEEEEGPVCEEQGKGSGGSLEAESHENCHSAEVASVGLEAAPELDALSEEESPDEPTSVPEPALQAQQRETEEEQGPEPAPEQSTEPPKALSSEEEEEEEEEAGPESILPPSVLNQASLIADMFGSSFSRRSSLTLEEGRPGGFLTPRLVSRSSSVLSLEGSETGQRHSSTADSLGRVSPLGEAGGPECGGAASPEPTRPPCRRKESLLSPRDRLLLDKIKSYYEGAEHRDASFSVRRRESLSYIPSGLVRSSVCRLNSLEPPAEARHRAGGVPSSSQTPAWALRGTRTTGADATAPKQGQAGEPGGEEEFRPPTELLPVWELMERQGSTQPCLERGSSSTSSAWALGGSQENGLDPHEQLLILEEDKLSAITEESAVPSPESWSPMERAPLPPASQPGQEPGHPAPPPLHPPRPSEAELSERLRNKVYQLARQYSLRIKSRPPAVHGHRAKLDQLSSYVASLPHNGQQEVKRGTGQKPALSLVAYEQVVLQEYGPHTPLSAASSSSSRDKSPKRFSFSSASPPGCASLSPSACSPLSPLVAETFAWPDVRELRSRYSRHTAAPSRHRPPPVNRSRSAPEQMAEELSGDFLGHGDRSQEGSQGPQAWGRRRHPSADALRVTAEAVLGEQRVIVMEKVPCAEELPTPEEPPDAASYVQIRSPTSRERISLKAVAERCKAYQESDEYRQREDSPAPEPGQAVGCEQLAAAQPGRVRNLREKFQTLNAAS